MASPITTQTLTSRDIQVLHLESTDVCQASCSLCARETDANFDKSQKHHLDMWKIMQVFDADRIAALDKMFMCGNYGDPAAGRYTLNIYRQFRKINPSIVLGMNTNGALRTAEWWRELANILNQPQDYVVFSIDGLEDTNHLYRTGVDWQKLMRNVNAFIDAGGQAHWDMLVYKHNEHQVDHCEQLAKNLGFKWFRAKVSKRPVKDNLQMPVFWKKPISAAGPIVCHALKEKSLYIDSQGRVSPCCWLGSRQKDFVTNFEIVQQSWVSNSPNAVCQSACGTQNNESVFESQWQKSVAFE